ncbi:MAG TPA: sigma-70 family RNA polymerase sigma factor [Acidothermaceae bacterium]
MSVSGEAELLVRAAQLGDALALAELLDLIAPAVTRWCAPIALQDAQDAAQEALISILRNLHSLRDPAAIYGWARTVAVREAVRVARSARRELPTLLPDGAAADGAQLGVEIRDVLARLDPEQRAVLMLRDVEGLDEHTAAMVLSVPQGTVKSRLFRARRKFRTEWQL